MNSNNLFHIYIVDDNKLFAMALKNCLESHDFKRTLKISFFETGELCIQAFKHKAPDLVILDYNLNSAVDGAMDGLEVLIQIKQLFLLTSVIMLTSNDQIDTALKSFHHGASDYVVKTDDQFNKIINSLKNIFEINEVVRKNKQLENEAIELRIAKKELAFYTREKERQSAQLIILDENHENQQKEKAKWSKDLSLANSQILEVEKSKLIVEEKNKDITDSLNYARRIQQAKLPSKEKIYAALPQSFVLFKPKDIVSGDFYFFHESNDIKFIVAADCTGHGVPGAFMSMIGSEKLNDAINYTNDTSEILKFVNNGIKNSLQQSDSKESNRDGMDIAICSIDTKKRIVNYAGANRPLWIVRKGSNYLDEIKGTKMALGGLTLDNQNFDSHVLQLEQEDTFYISTDGFADQFGGSSRKKLMSRKFKEILLNIQNFSMQEQMHYLNDYIENWKSGIEQVDDILVIGVRL